MRSLRHENYSVRVVRICDLTAFVSPLVGPRRFLSHQGEPYGSACVGEVALQAARTRLMAVRHRAPRCEKGALSSGECREVGAAGRAENPSENRFVAVTGRLDASTATNNRIPGTPSRALANRATRIPRLSLALAKTNGAPAPTAQSGGRHLPRDRPVSVASEQVQGSERVDQSPVHTHGRPGRRG